MNKKSWLIVMIIVALVAAALVYIFIRASQTTPEIPPPQTSNDTPLNTSSEAVVKGAYLPYSTEAVAEAKGAILLFFHAPWCPQCREIEKTIVEGGLPDNTTVLKIDYDTNQALRQMYGVTLQTTFVKINNQGDKLKSYVAYDEPTFAAVQRELLP